MTSNDWTINDMLPIEAYTKIPQLSIKSKADLIERSDLSDVIVLTIEEFETYEKYLYAQLDKKLLDKYGVVRYYEVTDRTKSPLMSHISQEFVDLVRSLCFLKSFIKTLIFYHHSMIDLLNKFNCDKDYDYQRFLLFFLKLKMNLNLIKYVCVNKEYQEEEIKKIKKNKKVKQYQNLDSCAMFINHHHFIDQLCSTESYYKSITKSLLRLSIKEDEEEVEYNVLAVPHTKKTFLF